MQLLNSEMEKWEKIPDDALRSKTVLGYYMKNVLEPMNLGSYSEITDGPSDGGLDSYLISDTDKKVILLQCVWLDKPGASLMMQDARKLLHFYSDNLAKDDIAGVKNDVADFVRKFNSTLKGYFVEFRVVTNGKMQQDDARLYPTECKVINPAVMTDELYAHLAEAEKVSNQITFQLRPGKFFEWDCEGPAAKVSVIQCVVLASDLVQAYLNLGDKLLARNLRLLLSGKINKRIYETADKADRRGVFYLFHNGISIVCSQYDVSNESGSPVVKLTNAQVVNGGQSTATLAKVSQSALKDIFIPCKITATSDSKLATDIAISNNTQNAINDFNLIANNPEIIFLQNFAASMIEPAAFLKRKAGAEKWKEVKVAAGKKEPPKIRQLPYKKCAQAFLAFTGHPVSAYSAPTKFITPPSIFYWNIVSFPDPRIVIASGLISNYDDKIKGGDPFTKYWTMWAIAAFGHIFNRHLFAEAKQRALYGIMSSKGQDMWEHPIRPELIQLFKQIFEKYYVGPPELQYKEDYLMQGFFKAQEGVYSVDFVKGVTAVNLKSYVAGLKPSNRLSEVKNAETLGFSNYEVDFAIFAVAMDKEIQQDKGIITRICSSF